MKATTLFLGGSILANVLLAVALYRLSQDSADDVTRSDFRRFTVANEAIIAELADTVRGQRTVIDSNTALLDRLLTLVEQNADDPAQLRAVIADVRANTQTLNDAVVAHTIAENEQPAPAQG